MTNKINEFVSGLRSAVNKNSLIKLEGRAEASFVFTMMDKIISSLSVCSFGRRFQDLSTFTVKESGRHVTLD